MDNLINTLRHPNTWTLSVQLLVLYCVSVALFYAVDAVCRSMSGMMKADVKKGGVLSQIFLFALACAANALGVRAFIFICGAVHTVPRLAMIGLPLLLLAEKHARTVRSDRENRRLHLLTAAGMTIGILGAAFALMRDCPIK